MKIRNFKTHSINLITSDEEDDKEVNLYELCCVILQAFKMKIL